MGRVPCLDSRMQRFYRQQARRLSPHPSTNSLYSWGQSFFGAKWRPDAFSNSQQRHHFSVSGNCLPLLARFRLALPFPLALPQSEQAVSGTLSGHCGSAVRPSAARARPRSPSCPCGGREIPGWRISPPVVHSVNFTSATSFGLIQVVLRSFGTFATTGFLSVNSGAMSAWMSRSLAASKPVPARPT